MTHQDVSRLFFQCSHHQFIDNITNSSFLTMQNRNDQQDPYDRPQSADPRRERDRNSDRDRRSGRNRKSSPSPAGLRGIMKKNFEMSDTGITSGALGTFCIPQSWLH